MIDACWGDYCQFSIVKTLLAAGAEVDFVTENGNTCLIEASRHKSGRDDIVACLLQHVKALPASKKEQVIFINNAHKDTGMTALHYAVYATRGKTAKMLVKRGARVDLPDKDGQTPMDYCKTAGS